MLTFQRDPAGTLRVINFDDLDLSRSYISRHDFASIGDAQAIADELDGEYMAIDRGTHVSPRYDVIGYDVIEKPVVGNLVSRAFNGDSYSAGEITSISSTMRKVTTSTGEVFWRRRLTGAWVADGTWAMVSGHAETRNPSF